MKERSDWDYGSLFGVSEARAGVAALARLLRRLRMTRRTSMNNSTNGMAIMTRTGNTAMTNQIVKSAKSCKLSIKDSSACLATPEGRQPITCTYRLRHVGDFKPFSTRVPEAYEGVSREFTLR